MNRMITLGDLVGGLDGLLELQGHILGYLSPSDMSVATLVNKGIKDRLGYVFERTLGYQGDSKLAPFRNYNIFVKSLVTTIQSYSCLQIPHDIDQIVDLAGKEAPSVVQVRKLQEFIKARDTLVVWKKLADQTGIEIDFSMAFESAERAIEQAKGFASWIEKNREELNDLHFLDLSRNELMSIPKELGDLKGLQDLYLGFNRLKSIPKELGRLQNLTELNLLNNQLTSIPKELGSLGNLRGLYLSNNQLASIPKELGSLENLRLLNLGSNQLTSIPKELGNLKKLETLILYNNQLKSIPEELGNMENLIEADFRANQLTSIPKELGNLKKLKKLYLDDNQLKSIPDEVKLLSHSRIVCITLYRNLLEPTPERAVRSD